jgi:hypothetical protein
MTMTAQPSRQPEGIPTGGQFAKKTQSDSVVSLAVAPEPPKRLGLCLSERYFAAKAQMDAHDQNEWVKDVHEDHPEAAYAKVNIETDAGGRYTAGVDLYAADGTPIDLDMGNGAALEDDFDTDWDMVGHRSDEARALFGQDEVFSLKSIQDSWAATESSTEPAVDPFAHLAGMDKARAQVDYARQINADAVSAYVDDLSAKLLAINPEFSRLYVTRNTDVEYGTTFRLARVEDIHGNVGDVDLYSLTNDDFQDSYLDRHTDYDESRDESYINLDPGE